MASAQDKILEEWRALNSSRAKLILMAVFIDKKVTEHLPWAQARVPNKIKQTHGSQRFFHCSEAGLLLSS